MPDEVILGKAEIIERDFPDFRELIRLALRR
jgi:hypothetical protein